ncbi:MAG: prephenate dehydratase [Chloroflexi bacterium]|nr:prephenate dehydratase [Chloroflexota bacterium]|tara:strand:+ start:1113 stop:1943 length:831 start_codon:yes stop_codon:yes gene_type:complete
MKKNIAFLGPVGTYTEQAAFSYAPDQIRTPLETIKEVTKSIENGEVDECVLPIENSLGGTIIEVIDYLISSKKTQIKNELMLEIKHCLISKTILQLSEIKVIKSKFEAFQQCKTFIDTYLPKAKLISTSSTAAAVNELIYGENFTVAIGPKRAAQLANLPIVKESIQDKKNNITRFVVLSKNDHEPTKDDKTSIAFEFGSDSPGLIYSTLKPFSDKNINLTKIESRPTGKGLGSYFFLIDFEGHKNEPIISETLKEIKKHMINFKILGSYPKGKLP